MSDGDRDETKVFSMLCVSLRTPSWVSTGSVFSHPQFGNRKGEVKEQCLLRTVRASGPSVGALHLAPRCWAPGPATRSQLGN